MLPSPRVECASVEQTISHAGLDAARTCSPLRSSRAGRPLTSSATPRLERHLEHALEVERVFGGRWLIRRPVGWLRQRTCGLRIASRRPAPSSRAAASRWPACTLRCTQSSSASTSSGRSSAPSRQDVAFDPAQDPERRQLLVGGGDLLALAAHVVGVEPGHDADGRRVVADREVLVSALARGGAISSTLALPSDHVVWQCRSPRMSVELDQRRRLAAERRLAQLRRAPRHAERGVDAASSGASGSGPSAVDVRRRPVARTSSVPKRSGSAATSSIGTPSTVTPTARRSVRSTTATICGRRANASSTAPVRRRDDDRERSQRVPPAARVARQLAVRARRDRADELARRGQQQPARRPRLAAAGERRRAPCASVFGPMPGTPRSRPAAAAARNSSAVWTSRALADLEHPLRPEPDSGPSPISSGAQLALELVQLGDPPVSTSSRSRASIPARSRAARAPGRPARARPPAAAPRIVSAPRR